MVDEPEPAASVTVLPDTGLPWASFKVTVTVEVVTPSAVTLVGEATTVDTVDETVPTVKVTVGVEEVIVVPSVESVAVYVTA